VWLSDGEERTVRIQGIDHIELHVSDLDAAAKPWCAFGFVAVRRIRVAPRGKRVGERARERVALGAEQARATA
jgi:hypothetical protein